MEVKELIKSDVAEKLDSLKPKEFTTTNLLIATILMAKGFKYLRTEGTNFPRKFILEDRTDREQIINSIINGTLEVNISNYLQARKMLLTSCRLKEA